MVAVQNQNRRVSSHSSLATNRRLRKLHGFIVLAITVMFLFWIFVFILQFQLEDPIQQQQQQPSPGDGATIQKSPRTPPETSDRIIANKTLFQNTTSATCASKVSILEDLTDEQRNPTVGRRWMVRPPPGGSLYLMCCDTTKGPFHVLLHESWAPIGIRHLLELLEGGYFDTEIPLFRCTDACQFGLSANATLTKRFGRRIPDDPLWLPTGPEHRFFGGGTNDPQPKTKRYPKGVLTHAGAGNDSRSNQFVLTLKPNKFMGGGSPWEVPLGEVVEVVAKNHHHPTDAFVDVSLPDLYTGYGEKGPGQGLLHREGASEAVREQWPLLDYVLRCSVVDRVLEETQTG